MGPGDCVLDDWVERTVDVAAVQGGYAWIHRAPVRRYVCIGLDQDLQKPCNVLSA